MSKDKDTNKYFEVPVHIRGKKYVATFYQTEQNMFDLKYGWEKYSSGMSSTLRQAIDDFKQHLLNENPDQKDKIVIGEPIEITKEKADQNNRQK